MRQSREPVRGRADYLSLFPFARMTAANVSERADLG